jgi:hypothetical protein
MQRQRAKEDNNLYCSSNNVKVIKSRRTMGKVCNKHFKC